MKETEEQRAARRNNEFGHSLVREGEKKKEGTQMKRSEMDDDGLWAMFSTFHFASSMLFMIWVSEFASLGPSDSTIHLLSN